MQTVPGAIIKDDVIGQRDFIQQVAIMIKVKKSFITFTGTLLLGTI